MNTNLYVKSDFITFIAKVDKFYQMSMILCNMYHAFRLVM